MIISQVSGEKPYMRGPLRRRMSIALMLSLYAPAIMCEKERLVGSADTHSFCLFHCLLCCWGVISTGRYESSVNVGGRRRARSRSATNGSMSGVMG